MKEKEPKKGIPIVTYTAGISKFPEMEGKARAFFPTHNFDVIKHHREYIYKKFIVWEFANERVIKRVKTTEEDFKECRISWLNSELKEIARLIDLPSMTRSDQVELKKYRKYVEFEKLDSDVEAPGKEKKPCSSVTRARAFCVLLLQDAGMEPRNVGQNELIKISKKYFPKDSGKTVYDWITLKGLNLANKNVPKFKLDYEFGLKLFNEFKPK
jgi:hypothetical protein